MTTLEATRHAKTGAVVPAHISEMWLLPRTARTDIERLKQDGETANHVIDRLLRERNLTGLSNPNNERIGELLRDAVSKLDAQNDIGQ